MDCLDKILLLCWAVIVILAWLWAIVGHYRHKVRHNVGLDPSPFTRQMWEVNWRAGIKPAICDEWAGIEQPKPISRMSAKEKEDARIVYPTPTYLCQDPKASYLCDDSASAQELTRRLIQDAQQRDLQERERRDKK